MKLLLLIGIIFILPSCDVARVVRGEVAERSAEAADQTLESAEWGMCEGASIGAVKRKYNTPAKFKAYMLACGETW
jgi:hypothetical protein